LAGPRGTPWDGATRTAGAGESATARGRLITAARWRAATRRAVDVVARTDGDGGRSGGCIRVISPQATSACQALSRANHPSAATPSLCLPSRRSTTPDVPPRQPPDSPPPRQQDHAATGPLPAPLPWPRDNARSSHPMPPPSAPPTAALSTTHCRYRLPPPPPRGHRRSHRAVACVRLYRVGRGRAYGSGRHIDGTLARRDASRVRL